MFMRNMNENISECPLELIKMSLNIQKVPEQVCKHFKLLSEKMFQNNSQMFWIKIARNV